jgi:hypothetical protein
MAAAQDRPGDAGRPLPVTDAELRALLLDCLTLWDVAGSVSVGTETIEITSGMGQFALRRVTASERPLRWLLRTPDRRPRAFPSIVAALRALRADMIADSQSGPRD